MNAAGGMDMNGEAPDGGTVTGGSTARRVLMLCYYFPPVQAVGANRNVGFALNLRDFGWTPTVVSVERTRIPWERSGAPVPDGVTIVRAPEWNLHATVARIDEGWNRLFKLAGAMRAPAMLQSSYWIPDSQIAWRSTSLAMRHARQSDCVYVSCTPFSAVIAGVRVARRCRKPLVFDFRDPWQEGEGSQRWWERWALERADAVILNTLQAHADYARRFPRLVDRMVVIPNGYDHLPPPRPAPPADGPFTIMHLGEFYGSRRPDTLLGVLADLNLPGVEFVQVGTAPDVLARFSSRLCIRHIDTVPRERALALMQSASLLYLRVHSDTPFTSATVPAKAYEYLASGVPILAESPEGAAHDLVQQYGVDAQVVAPDRKDELAAAVLQAYGRRHESTGGVHPLFVERYNRRALTARLAAVLDAVVAGRAPATVTWP